MGSKVCMNLTCGTTTTSKWREGWTLRSGGVADLCDTCGSAYEQRIFCDIFHSKETGWRECRYCNKHVHCGCIVSKSSIEMLDSGGVSCIKCSKSPTLPSIDSQVQQMPMLQSTQGVLSLPARTSKVAQTNDSMKEEGLLPLPAQSDNTNGSLGKIKGEQGTSGGDSRSMSLKVTSEVPVSSPQLTKRDSHTDVLSDRERETGDSLNACLSISLGACNTGDIVEANSMPGTPNLAFPVPNVTVDGKELNRATPSYQQGQRSRHLLPKPPHTSFNNGSDSSKDTVPHIRIARPPGDGRGRNQLLPRYWPRITDQELQQISGDSNSTIVPLFEKVLSASDAGRIGRLVLPKACAEAYFPPISQPEGLPLKIQDAKGKEWVFQFRFWPNNNSRMYVLEGVTPCIQSMQLQAGDTVTFSRIDPERKLVMGFRKATSTTSMQETHISPSTNCVVAQETYVSGVIENLSSIGGYSDLLHSIKGNVDPLNTLTEQLNSSDTDWYKTEKHGSRSTVQVLEKKRTRNIGSKSKRLLIDHEEALELKVTWEEAQDLLRPPPSVRPNFVMIEDYEFEEYEEPPVFGKRTVFTARQSGGYDQWAQCDNCYRWRKLPFDALIPPRWTCTDNAWDPRRCLCSAPEEVNIEELEGLLRQRIDSKRRKVTEARKPQREISGLDALATVAALGQDEGSAAGPSVAPTTKHPRHRPGCTCIVCIQPPSGKGPKHKPTCTCNVCMTVKRRFKTLMMRRKKRQSEREAETARKKQSGLDGDCGGPEGNRGGPEVESGGLEGEHGGPEELEGVGSVGGILGKEVGKGSIDLNCQPEREEEGLGVAGSSRVSMLRLLREANLPLETYLKQQGLTSLASEGEAQNGNFAEGLYISDHQAMSDAG
ncbi:hypothetical protein AMTRI_Chr08g209650 [Amborella trichopoda]